MSDLNNAPWPRDFLDAFRAGESGALLQLYRAHAPALATSLRMGFSFHTQEGERRFAGYRSHFDLQDALAETFRLAFEPQARLAYDGLRPYGPYLHAIARNVVLRAFRRREQLFPQVVPEQEGAALYQDEPDSAETTLWRKQIQTKVRAFLDELPSPDRTFLMLRFVEGLSQRDAAEQLGWGRQVVRTKELKLRKRLLSAVGCFDSSLAQQEWMTVLMLLAG